MDEDRTLAGVITRALADRIVSGEIAPGSRLAQDHIAAEFKASHVPVREALRRLEAQGLAVSEPRRGTRVPPLDPGAVRETTLMRAALEALALEHALPHLTTADLAEARAALAQGEASTDIRLWETANRRFHRVLILPCGMKRLIAAIDDLHQASARFMFACWRNLDWQKQSAPEHRRLLDAIAAGDGATAIAQLRDHVTAAGEALIAAIQSSGRPPRPAASRKVSASPSMSGSKSA